MNPFAIYVFIKFEGGSAYPRVNSNLLHRRWTSDPPECWNYECMPLNPVYVALRTQTQGLCLLGKQPTPAATSMLPPHPGLLYETLPVQFQPSVTSEQGLECSSGRRVLAGHAWGRQFELGHMLLIPALGRQSEGDWRLKSFLST